MKALVTGGLGFVGRALARRLLERGWDVVVYDATPGEPPPGARIVVGDICDAERLYTLVTCDAVFHLAGIRGAQSEREFDLALRVNLGGSRALLEACRDAGRVRVVFASTLAVFGGHDMPATVDDSTRPNPQTTYGMTKAAIELLLADYTRKGFVDGRAGRLATVVVRPDAPALAASGFASAVIRETLAGRDCDLPVGLDTRLPVIGVDTAVECLIDLAELPPGVLGADPVLNLPSVSVTVGELVEAAERAGATGRVRERPDPETEGVVGTWPKSSRADRALALGLPRDGSLEAIVASYMRGQSTGKSG